MAFEPFGGLFDFNGDGKTDPAEMGLGLFILNELTESEKRGKDPFLTASAG